MPPLTMGNSSDHNAANDLKWSRRAVTFDHWRFDYFRWMQRALINSAKISAPCRFLDLGCGTGWALRCVAKLLAGQGEFAGVDISRGMIEKARLNSAGMPNVAFYLASAEDLPLEDNYFDMVISSNSFHHYLQPIEALKEVRRVLKPNGRVHIMDLASDDFFTRWIDARARASEKEHVRYYSSAEFARLFAQAGLKHIKSSQLKIYYPLKVHVGEKEQKG